MKKALLWAVLLTSPSCLFAQQKQLSLNEVVVTANKFDQKASQTGKDITVISQKDLEHQSGKTLGQVLSTQPGITINGSTGSPGTNQTIYLRGADPKYTLIMINGIPISDISNINSIFDINLIPVADIERIEILKGGSATLYGTGAVAGAINIITKNGGTKPFQASIGLDAGSYGTFKEQAGVHGRSKKADYSIRFQNMDSRGFSSALDSAKDQHFDKDGYHRQAVFANIGFHPGNNWTLRPFIRYTHQKGDMDVAAFVDDKDYYYTSDYFQTGISIKHTFKQGNINIKYSYIPVSRYYRNDSTDQPGYLHSNYKSNVHTADVYVHFNLNDHFSFLVGNAIKLEKTDQRLLSFSDGDESKMHLSSDSARANFMNIYGTAFYHTRTGFNLAVGGRLNQHNTYGFHPVYSINPSWLINDKVKLFANVATSYTAPSLYQLYSAYGNRNLNPETGNSYEAGIESVLVNQKIKISLTAFHRDMKNIIAFAGLHYINYDRQKASGGEAKLTYAPDKRFKLTAWYAYVTGKESVKNKNTGKDSSYNNLFKRPKNSAGLSLGYQICNDLYVNLNGTYNSSRKDLYFIGYSQYITNLKSYYLLNFYAQYKLMKRYRIYVGLNNITNSHYTETTGYATMGFNFNAGVRIKLF